MIVILRSWTRVTPETQTGKEIFQTSGLAADSVIWHCPWVPIGQLLSRSANPIGSRWVTHGFKSLYSVSRQGLFSHKTFPHTLEWRLFSGSFPPEDFLTEPWSAEAVVVVHLCHLCWEGTKNNLVIFVCVYMCVCDKEMVTETLAN